MGIPMTPTPTPTVPIFTAPWPPTATGAPLTPTLPAGYPPTPQVAHTPAAPVLPPSCGEAQEANLPEGTYMLLWGHEIPYEKYKWLADLDELTWFLVPSSGVFIVGGGGNAAIPIAAPWALVGSGGGKLVFVFNWRSGEVGVIRGYGGQVGGGVGAKVGGGINFGPGLVWGASSVENLAGSEYEVSASVTAGEGIYGGVAIDGSLSARGSEFLSKPSIDPVSGNPIIGLDVQLLVGVGAGAKAALTGASPAMNRSELWPPVRPLPGNPEFKW